MINNKNFWPKELRGKIFSQIFQNDLPYFPLHIWWGWEIFPHNHQYETSQGPLYSKFHFHYIISGEIILTVDGKESTLKAGDAFILTSASTAIYKQNGNTILEIIGCYIFGANISWYAEKIAQMCGNVIKLTPDHPALQQLLNLITYTNDIESSGKEIEMEQCIIYLIGLLMELHREVKKYSPQNDKLPLYDSIQYMLANYEKEIILSDIADSVHMSAHYFSSLFHYRFGYSPIQFLTKLRLFLSILLIKTTKITLKESAMKCGVTNSVKLCHICKKHLSLTPKDAVKLSLDELWPLIWPQKMPKTVKDNLLQFTNVFIDVKIKD